MTQDLPGVAAALVARGKGILAADETSATLSRRFDALGIPSTEETRRAYREMLFTAPGASEFISGVILQDDALNAWRGSEEGVAAGRQALAQRARCNSATVRGTYTDELEHALFTVGPGAPHRALRDD